MWEDPIVAEVRGIREELSARFDFDVRAIFADMRRSQTASGPRLVSPGKRTQSPDALDRGLRPSPAP